MKNQNQRLVNKLITCGRYHEDDNLISSVLMKDNNLYIDVAIVGNVSFSDEEITNLKNVTKIVTIKIREIPLRDYTNRKFMKISSNNYDAGNAELQDRHELADENLHIDYMIKETKFPCTVLNYM